MVNYALLAYDNGVPQSLVNDGKLAMFTRIYVLSKETYQYSTAQ